MCACVSLHWGRHRVSLSIMLHLIFLRQGLSLDADKSSKRSKCFLSPCLSLLFPAWLHNVEFPIQRQLVWWEVTYMVCSRSCGNGRQSVITTMCDSTLVGALSGLKSFFLIQIHGGFFFFLRMAVGFCQELLLHLWSHILLYRVLIPWMDGPGIQPEHLFSFWTHVVSVTSHSPIAWELSQGSKLWHLDICVLSLKDQPSLERGAEFEITLLAVLVYVVYVHKYVHVLTCMCVGVLCACVCTCVGVCTCMGAFCAPVCTCVWSFQGGTPGHYSALVGREGYR